MTDLRHTKTGDPARIAREAELLGAARHPGVVELVGIEGDPRNPVLLTRRVEGRVLSEGGLSRAEVAGVTAAMASTLAEIHQLGMVHGAVAPEHVILGPGGRPVLCSFGHGGRIGESAPARPPLPSAFLDPDRGDEDPLDPSVDVYGMGALLRALAEGAGCPRSDRLLEVAEDATAVDVTRRPTASRLAAAIRAAAPDACLPGGLHGAGSDADAQARLGPRALTPARAGALDALRRSQATPTARRGLSRHRRVKVGQRRRVAVAGVGAVVVVLAVVLAARGVSGSGTGAGAPSSESLAPAVVPATEPLATATTARAAPTTTLRLGMTTTALPLATASTTPATTGPGVTTTLATGADCPALDGPLAADIDGDGCPEALRYGGGILESASGRWSVGSDGDQVATGDWTCRGRSVLAVLHPPTGDVFVFDGWAGGDHDVIATAVARVEGGFALRAADLGDGGCPRLVVDRRNGAPVAVPIGAGE